MNKVELSGEAVRFLNNSSSKFFLDEKEEEEWLYLPYWFKKTDDPYIFEQYSFEELPEGMREGLSELRDGIKKVESE